MADKRLRVRVNHPGRVTRGTDTGAPGLHTHFEIGIEWADANAARTRVRVLNEWPIDRYHRRKELSGDLHTAATRLFDDFERSHIRQRVGMAWEEFIDQGLPELRIEDSKNSAEPFWSAMTVIQDSAGYEGEGLVWSVVLMGMTAGQWAAHKGINPTAGLSLLKLALSPLPRYYLTK